MIENSPDDYHFKMESKYSCDIEFSVIIASFAASDHISQLIGAIVQLILVSIAISSTIIPCKHSDKNLQRQWTENNFDDFASVASN